VTTIPDAADEQYVRAPKTAELIAAHLRGRIVRGELKPGDTLPPEVGLMSQLGVSRPTLREAFRILEAEALISVRRGSRGGARVTTPELSVAARYVGLLLQLQGATIVDVYDARMLLEPTCAALLARNRSEVDLADLRSCVDELRELVAGGPEAFPEPRRWSRLTYRFHELVLQRAGSPTLAVQGGVLQDIVERHIAVSVSRSFRDPSTLAQFRRTIRSYLKLIALVEAGDEAGSQAHWRTHMEVAARSLLRDDLRTKAVVHLFD
jgi:DNA-binding FadR family transcriptional regulator